MGHPAYNEGRYRAARAAFRGLPCHYCGAPKAGTVDHVIPVSRGGTNDASNLVPACGPCNYSKGGRDARARKGAVRRVKVRSGRRSVNPRWL